MNAHKIGFIVKIMKKYKYMYSINLELYKKAATIDNNHKQWLMYIYFRLPLHSG